MAPLRFLHLHSTFAAGGKELRAVRLMNAWRGDAVHAVVSAVPGAHGAAALIEPDIVVEWPDGVPLAGRASLRRLHRIAQAMRGYDLVLTYNWGAMDAVMAHRLFARALRLPPLVHHEDGFNSDEASGQKPLRRWWRRLALPTASRLVVPSTTLQAIALGDWQCAPGQVERIGNGIPLQQFEVHPAADAIPGFARRPGELVVGTMAGLRAVKNLPRLVRAFAAAGIDGRLVIVGEGPERAAVIAEADRLGVADRLHLPGFLRDPARYVGLFDMFALSSDSEQFPISVVEAMAAGLPVVAPAVGDVAAIVSPENRAFITAPADETALATSLRTLAGSPALRQSVGTANRREAARNLDERDMIDRYRTLYWSAAGRGGGTRHF